MAIINCPQCKKSISSKQVVCPHCELVLGEMSAEERLRAARKSKIAKQQSLMNQSFVALILFLSGFLVIYSRQPEPESMTMLLSKAAIAVGFIWYIINRILIVINKRALR